jgi:hypothetical protein
MRFHIQERIPLTSSHTLRMILPKEQRMKSYRKQAHWSAQLARCAKTSHHRLERWTQERGHSSKSHHNPERWSHSPAHSIQVRLSLGLERSVSRRPVHLILERQSLEPEHSASHRKVLIPMDLSRQKSQHQCRSIAHQCLALFPRICPGLL